MNISLQFIDIFYLFAVIERGNHVSSCNSMIIVLEGTFGYSYTPSSLNIGRVGGGLVLTEGVRGSVGGGWGTYESEDF